MSPAIVSGGRKPTYLMVDITPDDDCRGLERLLKPKGWVNLVRKLLPVKNPRNDEHRDDAHPDLVILNGTIQPAGKIVKAKTATGGFVDEECFLPFETVERNMELMRRWLWKPGVIGDLAARKGQLEDPRAQVVQKAPEYPELLFISSHGYPNGAFQQHYKRKFEPEHDHDYHVLFEVPPASSGTRWAGGVKWVIFSACNALRPELAWQWAEAMRGADGPRGILGFYSISPGPGGTVTYMTNLLAQPKRALVSAWARANRANPWSALVFEDAKEDTFWDWTRAGLNSPVNRSGKILYYHKTEAPTGIDVGDLDPRKMLRGRIFQNTPSGYEVAEALEVGATYTVVVAPPAGEWPASAEAIECSLVNLRENWWTGGKNPPDWRKMGATRIVNAAGRTEAIAPSQLRTKFGDPTRRLPDTVAIPKPFFSRSSVRWVGVEFTIPAEAYDWFHGSASQIWVKFEAIGASGNLLAKGSTIPQGLLQVVEAAAVAGTH